MNAHVRNCASGMIAFAAASAAFPVCAFADEGAGINAILPQMEEFIPMLVAFIILWIGMQQGRSEMQAARNEMANGRSELVSAHKDL